MSIVWGAEPDERKRRRDAEPPARTTVVLDPQYQEEQRDHATNIVALERRLDALEGAHLPEQFARLDASLQTAIARIREDHVMLDWVNLTVRAADLDDMTEEVRALKLNEVWRVQKKLRELTRESLAVSAWNDQKRLVEGPENTYMIWETGDVIPQAVPLRLEVNTTQNGLFGHAVFSWDGDSDNHTEIIEFSDKGFERDLGFATDKFAQTFEKTYAAYEQNDEPITEDEDEDE